MNIVSFILLGTGFVKSYIYVWALLWDVVNLLGISDFFRALLLSFAGVDGYDFII